MSNTDKDAQIVSESILERAHRLHMEAFGCEPDTIGLYWNDREKQADLIMTSIEAGYPYSDYDQMTEDQRKAYDSGDLLF